MDKKDSSPKLKEILAEHLGVEVDDIKDEDSFKDHLHMNPSNLSDFKLVLEQKGFDTKNIHFSEIETVGELINELYLDEIIE